MKIGIQRTFLKLFNFLLKPERGVHTDGQNSHMPAFNETTPIRTSTSTPYSPKTGRNTKKIWQTFESIDCLLAKTLLICSIVILTTGRLDSKPVKHIHLLSLCNVINNVYMHKKQEIEPK